MSGTTRPRPGTMIHGAHRAGAVSLTCVGTTVAAEPGKVWFEITQGSEPSLTPEEAEIAAMQLTQAAALARRARCEAVDARGNRCERFDHAPDEEHAWNGFLWLDEPTETP